MPHLFHPHIFRLHDYHDSIVSDSDPLFTSKFWKELMRVLKIEMKMATANHPQTNGQSEVMNRIVEVYLRIYCNYQQDDWNTHLPAAEFPYSSSKFHATGLKSIWNGYRMKSKNTTAISNFNSRHSDPFSWRPPFTITINFHRCTRILCCSSHSAAGSHLDEVQNSVLYYWRSSHDLHPTQESDLQTSWMLAEWDLSKLLP